jgi:hypothetical protein
MGDELPATALLTQHGGFSPVMGLERPLSKSLDTLAAHGLSMGLEYSWTIRGQLFCAHDQRQATLCPIHQFSMDCPYLVRCL